MSKRAATAEQSGVVVASYGRRVLVDDDNGERHECMLKGRKLRPVCADRVRFTAHEQGNVVVSIEARTTALTRPDRRGREEVLASNITRLIVVAAPQPQPDPFITDRYLAAAELIGAQAAVVLNKVDLLTDAPPPWLEGFARIGYPVLRISAKRKEGLDALADWCADGLSILVGQSGVGKSSLLNALVPDLELRTGTLSQGSGEGRHTTTASALHELPGGGAVIDSPGVRDYAPAPVDPAQVSRGYREIEALRGDCRFHNCLHKNEPSCAVLAALESGKIEARRYDSYRRLMNLMRQLRRRDDAPR
ncbi:MAG: ribosome small subunit-dependent GTPase A [Gammaproteobacteria bacterium]